jgi:hypothetical protein
VTSGSPLHPGQENLKPKPVLMITDVQDLMRGNLRIVSAAHAMSKKSRIAPLQLLRWLHPAIRLTEIENIGLAPRLTINGQNHIA